MVQDPNFWKRFSTAVHEDEAAKDGRADLKHSYVPPQLSSAPASAHTPLPLHPSAPVLPPLSPIDYTQSISIISTPAPAALPPQEQTLEKEEPPRTSSQHDREKKEPKRQPSKLKKSPSRASTRPLLPKPHPPPPPTPKSTLRCPSALSLNLSGRSKSNFKTWTTITANPRNRDSWLQGQKRKSRQRTWICWCFWLGLILLVAAVVVTLLVLRSHDII